MNLRRLFDQNKLMRHKTSKTEIRNLLRVIERDLKDAKVKGLSLDRKFATAYNAVLQSATILLHCRGYRPRGAGHHFVVFQAMKEIMGEDYYDLADYFDACRAKRNVTDYDYAGNHIENRGNRIGKRGKKIPGYRLEMVEAELPAVHK